MKTEENSKQRDSFSEYQEPQPQNRSQWGWVFLLLACLTAAGLRFWQLGDLPPGLYRDEAFNGLDALGILNGEHAFFFTANNGREPGYIYLSAISVAILGNTPRAIRLMAAVIGSLTTLAVYALGQSWYGRLSGLFAAWLWAITVWPIHLSRVGLRIVLAIPLITLTMWLGTLAWRKKEHATWLWLATGICCGLGFYSYLTARLLPAVLLLIIAWLAIQHKTLPWRGLTTALAGWLLAMLPLFILWITQPDILGGRTGQVSILNPLINEGDLVGTFSRNVMGALGMFFVRGDTIVRHNLPGRPVFDLLMTVPFLWGLTLLGQNWRKPTTIATFSWITVMLAATILAEDSPHFLRASGILPAALFPAAIALAWGWERQVQPIIFRGLVVIIIAGSLGLTIRDYFIRYPALPETSYLFEAAARDLAQEINTAAADGPVFVDQRYRDNWPSLRFLVDSDREQVRLDHSSLIMNWFTGPFTFFVWPLDGVKMDGIYAGIADQADTEILVSTVIGPETRGDLEQTTYPLYVRFEVEENPAVADNIAVFGEPDNPLYSLHEPNSIIRDGKITVDLTWGKQSIANDRHDIFFVHIIDQVSQQVVAQSDSVPGQGYWPVRHWPQNGYLQEQHVVMFDQPWDESRHQLHVGIYPADNPQDRLIILESNGQTGGNTVVIR
ncbi:MAG: glycosyltransferase family 39 protein [Chloroflexota bacterium]